MVAIVTGNALGLSTSSMATLGQRGANGSASVGRNGDMAYVNAATGNLVLQTQDEFLAGRGLSIESLRTYNSRGLFNDDNGDNWSMGVYAQQMKKVQDPPYSGVFKFVRTDRDGAQATYLNTYAGYYLSNDGEGFADRIYDNTTSWTWIDGNTGLSETYDVNTGRLLTVTDKSGNSLTYTYDGAGQLSSVTDANGEQTFYDYVGNQLRQVRNGFVKNGQFVSQTRVRYEYDGSNRLSRVTVDLTPEVDGVADGKTFVTVYGYDGTSKRVASITHNNDTVLRLQYDGSGRVQYAYDAFDKRTEYRYEATGRTRVIDPLGAETVYDYFATGELKSVSSLAGGNVLETVSYTYDSTTGDIASVTDGQNNVTTYSGYFSYERDAAGNTGTRTYAYGGNQLQTETRYFEPNAGQGFAARGTYSTTRYIYDEAGLNRLRFVISAEARVTEYRYDGFGQRSAILTYGTALYPTNAYTASTVPTESAMASWASQSVGYEKMAVQRVDTSYDARGQLSKTIAYAAVDYYGQGVLDGNESVTQYIYDQSGRLLQTISPTGGATSMVYDGFGRVVSRTEANGTTTISTYSDASNIVEQTITQTGLKTTSVYDKAGRLVSVQQTNAAALGLGETKYAYDADGRLLMTTDSNGVRHWMLYDEAGRKVGDIDGNGSLVEYTYNRAGQLTRTAAYATAVSTSALVDATGKPTAPALSTVRPLSKATDVFQWSAYDKAGRLVKTVNAEGAVSETFYDGADRIVKVTQYATRIATAGLGLAPLPESIVPALDTTRDRTSRVFYDTDGLLLGELDPEGYFVEYRYNVAGQRNWTLRYTNAVPAAYRVSGSFDTIVYYAGQSKTSTVNYYDNKGQIAAEVDAENYLTEFEYDKNGNLKRKVRYNRAFAGDMSPSLKVADLKYRWQNQPPFTQPDSQVTTWQYNEFHRVTLMTEPDGTVTKYDYDAVGNLVRTTRGYGQGTEERALNARYDAQGRLVAELAATDAWRLTTGMTDAQVAAVFEQYGVKHSYDKAGRRTSTSDRNGLTTLYFYDEDSHLTHTVNAMGEVEERRYNALGQLETTLHYGLRLDSTTRTQLRGGTTSIAAAVAVIANAANDSKTTFAYKLSGLVASSTELLKPGTQSVVQHLYNAFGGEIERRTDLGDGTGRVRLDTMDYDRRGLQTRSTADAGGAAIDTTVEYDAFGRVLRTWDDAGKLSETGYDRLGRVIRTVDRHGFQRGTLYDAFDRVLTQTDALGKVTNYTYNTAARSVDMVTPENVKVTTVSNRHGQTLSITDGKLQTTSYTYDKDGNLTNTTAPIASASTSQTFERGRLIEAFDANDVKVKYTYDDANRVLSREVDPDGLKLLTKYEYDSSGRQIKVTDPAGVVTRIEYDLAGRQVAQTIDEGAGRLNLRTEYTYDASGHVLTVTSPGGRITQYKYDALGRREEEIVDPAGLALRTSYTYDHLGNVRTRTDATSAVTRYAYDAEGWLQYSVDGAGGVTYQEYDKNGRVTRTTRYAKAISLTGLPAQFTSADIAARVATSPGKDAIDARAYDGDGRLRFSVDGNGAVVEYRYDKNSNVTERIAYAKAINVAAWVSGNPPVVSSTSDQRLRSEYDALDRLTYQADALGAVTRREYDDNGNLRRLTEYATKLTGTQTPGQVVASAGDRISVFVYDKANRETWRVDATGAARKSEYDNDGNLIARTSYLRTITAGTEPTSIASNPQDRIERFQYDGAGRQTYSVDAMNFVTRSVYNDTLNTRTVTRFATAIAAGAQPATVTANANLDQTDAYVNDKAGRLSSHTDAVGQTESYTYDGLGNKKTFTNKKGSVWQYEYDAAGRLTLEISPEVYLTAVNGQGGTLQQGVSADAALKTRFEYDALGNLLRRTEADGRTEQRTTSYEYDACGRQIKVTYPPVTLYGESTERSLTSQTFYDTLGNAVANIDVASKTSYKAYDLVGRLRYEVDAIGQVTGYERNTFGEAETVVRYWKATNLPTQTTAATVAALPSADALQAVQTAVNALDHSRDRSLTSTYDKLGRVLEVREKQVYTFDSVTLASPPDAKKTVRTYNAFGDVVKTRVSGASDNAAVDTYFYYDRLGHQTAQVDALGYVTVREFDGAGNMTASTEYAKALSAGAWNADAYGLPLANADDRKTTWAYDRLNRKTTETRVGVRFVANASAIPSGQPAAADIVTRYGYDALGNLTRTEDANGGAVLSYYDALGRVTAVASPATQGVNGTLVPLSIFLRDAYGNVAVKLDLANGAAQATEFTGVSRASAPGFTMGLDDAATDRRTVTLYDRMGRAIQTTDAEQHSRFSAYLANGQIGKISQSVKDIDGLTGTLYQIFEYDDLGRLVTTREPAPTNLQGTAGGGETRTELSYNAFGEITERRVDGTSVEFFEYDDVGQVWRTNSGDGVTRVQFYDVLGRTTAEVRSRGADYGNVDLKTAFTSAEAVKNAVAANHEGLRYTLTQYDALGRVLMKTEPVRTEKQGGVTMKTQTGATAVVESGNKATLTWGSEASSSISLASLGAGDVRVDLTYTATTRSGGAEPVFESRTTTRSQIFSADQSATGVAFTSIDDNETLTSVQNFVVWKKDASGIYQRVLDRPIGATSYSVEVALPPDPTTSVRFETQTGTSQWIAQTSGARFGSVMRFDLAQLGSSSFNYRVYYDRLNPDTGLPQSVAGATGQFAISGAPVLQAIPVAATGGFGAAGAAASVLAWQKPPSGTTQVLNYRLQGGNWLKANLIDVASTHSGFDTSVLQGGDYEYELLWTASGQTVPGSHATGTFKVTPAVTAQQTSGTPNIAGIQISATQASWDTQIDGKAIVGTAKFEWRRSNESEWHVITPGPVVNNRASVDISALTGGAHEFRISYTNNGVQTALGTANVSVSDPVVVAAPDGVISNRVTVLASGFTIDPTGTTLSWANTAATTKFEYRERGANGLPGTGAWTAVAANRSGTTGSVAIGGLPADKSFEFRITSEEAAGATVTIGAGNLRTFAPNAGIAQPPQLTNTAVPGVAGLVAVGQEFTWDQIVGTTVKVEGRYVGSSVWVALDANTTTSGGKTRLSLSTFPPGDYEFRISHYNGDALVAFDARSAKLYPDPAAGTYFTDHTAGRAIASTLFVASATSLSWTRPAFLAPGTARFEYIDPNDPAKAWRDLPVTSSGATDRIDLPIGLTGTTTFRVTYRENNLVVGGGGGNIVFGSGAPVVSASDLVAIAGLEVSGGRLRWNAPAAPLTTKVFIRVDGVFADLAGVTQANGQCTVALPATTDSFKSYEYLVQYLDSTNEVVAVGGGTVERLPTSAQAQPLTFIPSNSRVNNITADRTTLSWDVRPGTPKFERRLLNSGSGWTPLTQLATVGNRESVSIAGLNGDYEWRITYTEGGDGGISAIEYGTVSVSSPTPVLSNLTSSQLTGFTTAPGRVSWVKPAGTTGLSIKVHNPDGSWAPLAPESILTEGNLQVIDLSAGGSGNPLEVLIAYTTNELVTHVMRGVVTTPPAGSVAAANTAIAVEQPSASRFSWTDVPGAGTPTFQYRLRTDTAWRSDLAVGPAVDGKRSVDTSSLDGRYDYRVSYANSSGITALATGQLDILRPVPQLSATDGAVLKNMDANTTRWSWDRPALGTGIGKYRPINGTWTNDVPVQHDGGRDFFDLLNATPGSYEYVITYTYTEAGVAGGVGVSVETSFSAGTFVVPTPATVSAADRADIQGLTQSAERLTWSPNAAGTAKFAYRVINTTGPWLPIGVQTLNGKHTVDLAGLNGSYDYRISYELPDGSLVALDAGRMDTSSTQPTVPAQGDSRLLDLTTSPTQFKWQKKAGTLKVEYREGTAEFTALAATSLVIGSTYDAVDLSLYGPLNGDFRITYTNGGVVTAMAMGKIQGGGWTASNAPVPNTDANVTGVSVAGTTLSWTSTHAVGTPQFWYRNTSGGSWTQGPAPSGKSVSIATLANTTATYEYRIVYKDGDAVTALGTGQLATTAASASMGITGGGKVEGFQVDRGQVRWAVPAGATGLPDVRVRQAGTQVWSDPLTLINAQAADISTYVASGNWEVRVAYSSGGETTHVGTMIATVNASVASQQTSSEITGIAAGAGPVLMWNKRTIGTPVVQYLNGTQWLTAPGSLTLDDGAGRSSWNFGPLSAWTYNFRIIYTQGADTTGFASGVIQFLGGTSAPLVTKQTDSFFGSSIMAGLGELSWTRPPAASGSSSPAKVEYRVAGSGAAWTSVGQSVLTRNSGQTDYVNIAAIGSGYYEFRIYYENSLGMVAGATPRVQIFSAPTVVSQTVSSLGSFTLAGTQLSWDAPASGGTPVFEYLAGASWIPGPAVGSFNGKPSVNVQGIYGSPVNFRVRYTANGYNVAFGSGSFNATQASQPVHTSTTSSISGYRIEAGKLAWNRPASGGTGTFWWRPAAGGTWLSTAASSDNFDLAALGGGSWSWRVTYSNAGVETSFGSGTLTVPSSPLLPVKTAADVGPVNVAAASLSLEWPPLPVTGAVASFKVWNNGTWELRTVETVNGKHSVSISSYTGTLPFRIEYTLGGQVVGLLTGSFNRTPGATPQLLDTTRGEVEGISALGTTLRWTRPAAGGTVKVYTRLIGEADWTPRAVAGETASLAGLSNGQYEFRIEYRDANQLVTAMAMGNLLPQKVEVTPAASTNVGGFQVSRTQLSWDKPVLSGVVEKFEYYDEANKKLVGRAVIDAGNNRRAIDVTGLENVSFRVVYADAVTGEIKALGTGTYSIGAMSAPVLTPVVSTISQPVLRSGRLVWDRPASVPVGSNVVFERLTSGGTWSSAGLAVAAQDATHDRIELSALGAGSYQWRVRYTQPGTGLVLAIGSGSLVVPASVTMTDQTLGNVTGIQADATNLSWNTMPEATAGTVMAEVFNTVTNRWDDLTGLIKPDTNGRPSVPIPGLVGAYDFRISYGVVVDQKRQILALATGRVTGTAGSASRTLTASPVGNFETGDGVLSWTPGSGAVEVDRRREGTTTWERITQVDTNGARHSLTIGELIAGNYEYRVAYKQGTDVTAMARIGVTIAASAPIARPAPLIGAAVVGITGFTVPGGTHDVRWNRPTGTSATPGFEYRRLGTAEWLRAPVGGFGTQDGVDIRNLTLAAGTYEFRVQYRDGAGVDTKVRANGAGRFTVPTPVAGTQVPVLQLGSAAPAVLGNITGTPRSVSWNAPPNSAGQNVLVEARLLDQATWAPVAVTRGGVTDSVNFNFITQASNYEFRITYTDAAGLITALGSGVVKFGNPTLVRTDPSVELTTPPYVAARTAAPAQYSATVDTETHPSAISDPRLGFSAQHSGGVAPGDYATRPKIEQKIDRWGNVLEITDPRNAQWKTTYKWNWANQLVEQVRPIDESNGSVAPTTRLYYDALGRQVGITDAKGNTNRQVYDKAGHLIDEWQADQGHVTHRYDALGNKVQTTDAVGNEAQRVSEGETAEQAAARRVGRTTDFSYDRMGRLTKAEHGTANVYSMNQGTDPQHLEMTLSAPTLRRIAETFSYDEAGRKLTQTNGNNETTQYKYDAAGRVVELRQPMGTKTTTRYDAFGFKQSETDANGKTQTWQTDAYGRMQNHTDLSGALITYTYDKAGLLQTMTGTAHTVNSVAVPAQNQEFKYDQAGQLLEINDIGTGRITNYRYDAAGNRVLERTEQVVGSKTLLLQDNYLGYDAQGRLRHIFDGHLDIAIQYDLNGNRQRITTAISVLSAVGASQETAHNSVRNFAYDAMNRQTVVEEYDETRGIVRHDIRYYLDGNRKSDSFIGNRVTTHEQLVPQYNPDTGEQIYTALQYTFEQTKNVTVEESYRYDNLGRLQSVSRDGIQVDLRKYDGAGRALQTGSPGNLPKEYTDKLNEGVPVAEQIGAEMRLSNYDKNGRLVYQNTLGGDGELRQGMDYIDRGDGTGYDAAGNLKGYRVHVANAGVVETHRYTQGQFDGYVVATETATDKQSQVVTSTSEYDANGHLKKITDSGKPANNREIYSDSAGKALLVDQGGKLQRQLIVNGEVLGSYGIGLDDLKPRDDQRNPRFAAHVDFEWGFQQINGHYPAASPGAYSVRQGDTLQGIARGAYGDSRLWYRIAEANGLSSDSDLRVGQTLMIPTGVGGVHNANDTFEPYDPSKVVGDTSPTLPVPKGQDGRCGAMSKVIGVVVAAIVTVATYGNAALGAMAGDAARQVSYAMLNGQFDWGDFARRTAIGGALGPIAGDIYMGHDSKHPPGFKDIEYDYKSTAIAGVAGYANTYAGGGVTGAAVGNVVGQGLNMAVGRQDSFNWKSFVSSVTGIPTSAADAAGMAAGYVTGYAMNGGFSGAEQQTQGEGPWSDKNYVNEFDRQSDRGDEARWIAQSDAIQQRRMNEAAAPYREQQWISQNDTIMARRAEEALAGRNGVDVQSDAWVAANGQGKMGYRTLTPPLRANTAASERRRELNRFAEMSAASAAAPMAIGEVPVQQVMVNGQKAPLYQRALYRIQNRSDPDSAVYGPVNLARDYPVLGLPSRIIGGIEGYLRGPAGYDDTWRPVYWNDRMQGFQGEAEIGLEAASIGMVPTPGSRGLAVARSGFAFGQESGYVITDSMLNARIGELAHEGHALGRHGGSITDQQLFTRATTGVAPDGSSVIKGGQVQIPPSSTAFNSDAALARADLMLRQGYLDRALALSPTGAQRVTIEGVDVGAIVGRGYDRVATTLGGVGPLRYSDNLTKVTGVYQFNAGKWETVTIYPVKK